jgi:PTH1 family peptidyl-tRNA hydrolase
MVIIAGLGNPGKKYEKTRHNMGFLAIDELAEKNDIKVNKLKHKALIGDGRISGQRVLLVKPQTYMNLSGESLREIVDYYDIAIEDLIVIYDDLDVEIGGLRVRKKGSAGSHNGMKSIVQHLGSKDFPRVRVGIGQSKGADWKDFVLSKTSKTEEAILAESVKNAALAVECILSEGIDKAMNLYNIKPEAKRKENSEE